MNHKDLQVWIQSMELVTVVYKLTEQLPKNEDFGLKSQLQRAAVSIPTNIAEGAGRNHQKENIQFCHVSLGSLTEVETLLIISNKIYQIQTDTISKMLQRTKELLLGYIRYLKRSIGRETGGVRRETGDVRREAGGVKREA